MPDPVTVSANSKAFEDNDPIRFNSHHHHQRSRDLLLSSTSIEGQRQRDEVAETVDTNRQKMDQIKAKRISFGRTTFKTRSTDEPEMDINDVDNRVRRKTNGVNDQDPEGTVGRRDRGSQLPLCSVGGDISDRDKSWAKRKQVRRTRRSSSADCTRMNDWVLSSSSSSSSSGSEDANDEDNRTANIDGRGRRGRSRTRKKKPHKRTQQDEGSSTTHKLIVQGKPQIPRRPANINLFKGNYINLFFFYSQSN